jgi:hypothetical protein
MVMQQSGVKHPLRCGDPGDHPDRAALLGTDPVLGRLRLMAKFIDTILVNGLFRTQGALNILTIQYSLSHSPLHTTVRNVG